jgi:hypothetical protein
MTADASGFIALALEGMAGTSQDLPADETAVMAVSRKGRSPRGQVARLSSINRAQPNLVRPVHPTLDVDQTDQTTKVPG